VREEKLLREVGYQVRGGSCRVRGQEMVFLDRDLPLPERVEILLDELSRRQLDKESLSPSLRRFLGDGAAPSSTRSVGSASGSKTRVSKPLRNGRTSPRSFSPLTGTLVSKNSTARSAT